MTNLYTHVSLRTSMGEWSGVGCRVNRILSLISIKGNNYCETMAMTNSIAAEISITVTLRKIVHDSVVSLGAHSSGQLSFASILWCQLRISATCNFWISTPICHDYWHRYTWQLVHMWQSRVEIKYYSIAYFDCVTAFKAPYLWTSVKGGAQTCCVNAASIDAITHRVWAPPLRQTVQYPVISDGLMNKQAINLWSWVHGVRYTIIWWVAVQYHWTLDSSCLYLARLSD